MACGKCGHWAYQYDWIRHRLGENNTLRWDGYADPDDPSIYWFIVCRPDCQLNAVRHASFRLEQEAAATMWWNFYAYYAVEELQHAVKRAVEELREAWIIYYAYC